MFGVKRGLNRILKQVRSVHTNDSLVDNVTEIVNKNPRNLELLRIAKKPKGFHLDSTNIEYYHKIVFTKHPRHVVAEVEHFENGVVLSVSSKEAGIRRQLYSLTDTSTFMNLGTILAKRCLESGIYEVYYDLETETSEKLKLFIKSAEEAGLKLSETKTYYHALPQTRKRQLKPWEVHD